MAKMYNEKDVKKETLKGKKIAIIGYGSQGRAHALNLKESGYDVVVGLRAGGKTWKQAEADGFKPVELESVAEGADLIAFLTPDLAQPETYTKYVQPKLKKGAALLFAHGFNIHYKQITPPADVDVILVAPKGPGALVRRQYQEGRGVPCLFAVYQNASGEAKERALAYADGLGGTKAGVMETTFAEETETDLFGEQAVLCGGATELITAGWETLVEAGYQPEVAYFECLHELKLIVDLIYEGGITKMHQFISDTAKYGDLTQGPRVINAEVKQRMKEILTDIQTGVFAKDWVLENQANCPKYKALLEKDLNHPIEKVGREVRANMSWIAEKK